MKQVEFFLKSHDAKNLTRLLSTHHIDYKESTQKKDAFSHWLETTNIIITIIASSVVIVQTIKNWIESRKKDQGFSGEISINNIHLNITKDYDRISLILDKISENQSIASNNRADSAE